MAHPESSGWTPGIELPASTPPPHLCVTQLPKNTEHARFRDPPTRRHTAIQLELVVQIHQVTTSSMKCNCGPSTVFNAVWTMRAISCTPRHVTILVRDRTAPIFCTLRKTMGKCLRTTTNMSPSLSEICTCKNFHGCLHCLKDHGHVSVHNNEHVTILVRELHLRNFHGCLHCLKDHGHVFAHNNRHAPTLLKN